MVEEDTSVVAIVAGQPVTVLPKDLFIPPDALEILLDSFTGPLDLLLYLIRQQNINIMDIPMALITEQYLQYIEWMEARRLELAADYLLMAALLIEIKSKGLLPRSEAISETQEEDPRMELVRRLQRYEEMKQASLLLDALPRLERDVFQVQANHPESLALALPKHTLSELLLAMRRCMSHQKLKEHHQIQREPLSVRERMVQVLQSVKVKGHLALSQLLQRCEGRTGLVVTLLALLELQKQSLLQLEQEEAYSVLYVRAASHG